jgi:hypothetical protein
LALLISAALPVVATLAAPAARAAACCMSATAVGMGRLLIWEDFAVGFSTSVRGGVGSWSSEAAWTPYGDYEEIEWTAEVWSLIRLQRRTSLHLRVPTTLTYRRAGDLAEVGGGLADLGLGARFEILEIGEFAELPALAVTVSVSAPTGVAPDQSTQPLGTDVTSRGPWVLSAGLSLEKTTLPWFVRCDVGVDVPLPAERADLHVTQRFGPGVSVALVGGYELTEALVASLLARFRWEAPLTLAGATIDGSSRHESGLALALSYRVTPHWTLQLGLDTPIPVDHLGDNQPGRVSGTVGVRYGYF